MSYPRFKTIEEAFQEIDKQFPIDRIKRSIDVTGEILRISLLNGKKKPTVQIITRRIVSRFLFFKKTKLIETILEFSKGWKQQYPDDKEITVLDLEPVWKMTDILYDKINNKEW